MKIDWKHKLTSRKFWLAVIGFVTPLMIAFGATESAAAEVAALIMSGASLIAYIIGEGLVDAEAVKADVTNVVVEAPELDADKIAGVIDDIAAMLGGTDDDCK